MHVIIQSAVLQGLVYCFMVLGVFITFRVLDFPDLTVDGSLPLGAAVTGALIVGGHSPLLATLAGVVAGARRRRRHRVPAPPAQVRRERLDQLRSQAARRAS